MTPCLFRYIAPDMSPQFINAMDLSFASALQSRVLIIEGISGSGKDTFQSYLKEKLEGRHVYDYSEGELLHSWKHFPIEGILELRVKFERLFATYMRDVIKRDESAVFLLNRFHLSTYVSIAVRQPALEKECDETLILLRTLPVHVFILELDETEIEARSLHSERSSAWRKLQEQMITKDGFRNRLEKYVSQQRLIIDAAKRQRMPYSLIKLHSAPAQVESTLPLFSLDEEREVGGASH